MSRLLSAVRWDLRLQRRYGIYYAGGFVTLVWIAVLLQIPSRALNVAVPFIVFTDLGVIGFYFIAGILLLEKGERTLRAVQITPLRLGEYLEAKLITLTLLAVVISLLVVVASYGPGFNLTLLLLGVVLASLIALLVGLIAVAPFDSISRFMIPSQLYLLVMYLPLMHYFGWWRHPVFYLIPTHGSLLLLRGAFAPMQRWQMVYAVLYQLLWLGLLIPAARRRFHRHISGRAGAG